MLVHFGLEAPFSHLLRADGRRRSKFSLREASTDANSAGGFTHEEN